MMETAMELLERFTRGEIEAFETLFQRQYLRAYMAGVTVPSVFLLFVFLVFCVTKVAYHPEFPIERILIFPMPRSEELNTCAPTWRESPCHRSSCSLYSWFSV